MACFLIYCGILTMKTVLYYKQPVNLFEYGTTKLYIANSQWGEHKGDHVDHLAVPKWNKTFISTVEYLKKRLKPGETFLAIPYDALYYFFSGHDSAVYPLAFFSYNNISPQDEKNIVQQLEEKKVQYVLISDRAFSRDPDLGIFGVDYCPMLKKYIFGHYRLDVTMGDGQGGSNFAENHGVMILKRQDNLVLVNK